MTVNPEARGLRLVFAGTPAFAAAHLQALIQNGFNVVSAYSQPDRHAGRGKKLLASPVKEIAVASRIPVYQPLNFRDAATVDELHEQKPDLMIVVAYGLLLPVPVLGTPRYGCLNVHASLLPRWRGAAPIERSILAGDAETGVCIMQMEAGLDTGPVLMSSSTAISDDDTGGSLGLRLQEMGCALLVKALNELVTGTLIPTPQDEAFTTYASKITSEDALVSWNTSAAVIHRQIRALIPRYPAYTYSAGSRLRIMAAEPCFAHVHAALPGTVLEVGRNSLLVACGENSALRITSVQPEGRRAMDIASVLNGHPDFFTAGMCFTSGPIHA